MAERSDSYEELTARDVVDELESGARQVAQLQGPAPGLDDVVGERERQMWHWRDPTVTPETLAQLLVQARANGIDEQDALGIITLKAYKFRGPMILAASDDPKEQAAYARRLSGRRTSANAVPPQNRELLDEIGGY